MSDNYHAEKISLLRDSILNANYLTRAAFLLVPYERIVQAGSYTKIINLDHYLTVAEHNAYEFFLRDVDSRTTGNQFHNFANFLPNVNYSDRMKLLNHPVGFDDEPLFIPILKYPDVAHRILTSAAAGSPEINTLMHMKNKDGKSVFPRMLDEKTLNFVLECLKYELKIKLFNEYVDEGYKTFVLLPSGAPNHIQQNELLALEKSDAYALLTGPANKLTDQTTPSDTVIKTMDDTVINVALKRTPWSWSDKELYGLATAGVSFFTWDFTQQYNVLLRLNPEQRAQIIFSQAGHQHMEHLAKYSSYNPRADFFDMLLGITSFSASEHAIISGYRERMLQRINKEKEDLDTFAVNFTPTVYQILVDDILGKNR